MTPASSPSHARSIVNPRVAERETASSNRRRTTPASAGQPSSTPPPRMSRAGFRIVTRFAIAVPSRSPTSSQSAIAYASPARCASSTRLAFTRERSPPARSRIAERAPAASSSRTRVATFMPEVYASRQPSSPQPQRRGAVPARAGRTFTCPNSPATPVAPLCRWPPTMIPDPTPEPTKTSSTSSSPFAAPKRFSPHAATARSFATFTGTRSASARRSPKGTSRQPRFGAFSTTPVVPRHWPATPTPTREAPPGATPAADAASSSAWRTTSTTRAGARSRSGSLCAATISPDDASTTAARAFVPPRSTPRASGATSGPHVLHDLVDLAAHEPLDLGDPLGRLRLEPEHEERLRVGGADEPPAVREHDAHAVDRHRLVARAEELLRAAHDLELLVLGAVDAELRGRARPGDVGEQRGERRVGAGEELEQAARRVDAVVEAEPAVPEEDVAAHLAREDGLLLLHLRLDEAVPRLPHDRAAAALRDVVVEREGALHLADDRGARHLGEERAREEDHELVAPEDVPLLVDRADAIGVAVVGDPDVRLRLEHLRLQVLEVLLDGGIRVVVREPAVHLDEERHDLDPERLEERHRDDAARPVPRVDDDLELAPAEPQGLLHVGAVRRHDVV